MYAHSLCREYFVFLFVWPPPPPYQFIAHANDKSSVLSGEMFNKNEHLIMKINQHIRLTYTQMYRCCTLKNGKTSSKTKHLNLSPPIKCFFNLAAWKAINDHVDMRSNFFVLCIFTWEKAKKKEQHRRHMNNTIDANIYDYDPVQTILMLRKECDQICETIE